MAVSKKVGIISGRYPLTRFNSAINHKVYADRFGYTYIHCNWPTQTKNPYFNKIEYLLAYIDLFDYLIWIDDDAFFYDFSKDIMQFAPADDTFLSICKSPSFKELKTYLSSGQFIIKCNTLAKQFLNEVKAQNLNQIKKWWEPSLGYFTRGDQDAIVYLLLMNPDYKDKFTLYDYKCFNSRFENLFEQDVHTPLILHFTGKPEIKWKTYLKTRKHTGLHSSLVPETLLKKYNNTSENNSKGVIGSFLKRIKRWF